MVRDAAESIIGPHFARTRWRLLLLAAPSVLILRSGEGRVSKDGCNGRCGHNLAFPRHDLPEFCIDIALAEERAPGARRTRRSLVCNRETHELVATGTPKHSGTPCIMGYGLYGLSPVTRYSIHTFRKPTLLQWVSRTPALGHQVSPQSKEVALMTHVYRRAIEPAESDVCVR